MRGRNKELGPQSKPRAEGSTPHSAIQDWIETGKLIKGSSGQILSEQQTSPDVLIENKMKCQLCQEPLDGSKHAFLQHVRSHPKEQRFECTDCPDRKRYPNILPFFEHRHNKHGLPYPSGLEVYTYLPCLSKLQIPKFDENISYSAHGMCPRTSI